jgi:hypothetical protein
MAEHLRRIALRDGWEISDLARALICLGASASFLRLENDEAADRFKMLATLGRSARVLDATVRKVSRRPRASPRLGVSDLLGLRLPQGLLTVITAYAATSGRSRNEAVVMFLERGLIIYLKGQNILLETIRSLKREQTKAEGNEQRKD